MPLKPAAIIYFFHGISTGRCIHRMSIRNHICDILENFSAHLFVDQNYVQVHQMRESSHWAGEAEISACASLWNTTIYLFTVIGSSSGRKYWRSYPPNAAIPSFLPPMGSSSIFLEHQNAKHFVPVFDA